MVLEQDVKTQRHTSAMAREPRRFVENAATTRHPRNRLVHADPTQPHCIAHAAYGQIWHNQPRLPRSRGEEKKMPPVLDPKLAAVLRKHHSIGHLLAATRPETLRTADEPAINALDTRVKAYLRKDLKLLRAWEEYARRLRDAVPKGTASSVNAVAAAILLGGAVRLPGLTLKVGLSPRLTALRSAWARGLAVGDRLHVSGGGDIVVSGELMRILEGFGRLKLSKRLSAAITDLLTDSMRIIRVGASLSDLDPDAVVNAISSRYMTAKASRAGVLAGAAQRQEQAYAPTRLALQLSGFECVHPQEHPHSDEVFWVAQLFSIKNLDHVMTALETAMKNDAPEVSLDIEWQSTAWTSDLIQNVRSGTKHSWDVAAGAIGEIAIRDGFGPWICTISCIEDDDVEYQAIKDVVDSVGDYAQVVSGIARTVAVISGPTAIGAAAGAVASAASLVNLAADTTSAVVSIVNWFDSDDVIGTATLVGETDYARAVREGAAPTSWPATKFNQLDVDAPGVGGSYKLDALVVPSGEIQVERTWRVRSERITVQRTHTATWMGESGDDWLFFFFQNGRPHVVVAEPLTWEKFHERGSPPPRHADWTSKPSSVENLNPLGIPGAPVLLGAQGVVHWGTRGANDITYTAAVRGYTLIVAR